MRKDRPEDAIAVKGRPFTGAEYLESLRDGREVWICGERVADVTAHPAFRNAARTVAKLYDALHNPTSKAELTVATDTGSRSSASASSLSAAVLPRESACSTAHAASGRASDRSGCGGFWARSRRRSHQRVLQVRKPSRHDGARADGDTRVCYPTPSVHLDDSGNHRNGDHQITPSSQLQKC